MDEPLIFFKYVFLDITGEKKLLAGCHVCHAFAIGAFILRFSFYAGHANTIDNKYLSDPRAMYHDIAIQVKQFFLTAV